MTRKRIGTGLLEAFSEPCQACGGRGVVVHHDPIADEVPVALEPTTPRRRRGRSRVDEVTVPQPAHQPIPAGLLAASGLLAPVREDQPPGDAAEDAGAGEEGAHRGAADQMLAPDDTALGAPDDEVAVGVPPATDAQPDGGAGVLAPADVGGA
jgi:ribonuclease E